MVSNTISAVIIDDENDSINTLSNFLSLFFPEVSIIGKAFGVEQGKNLLTKIQPELVFLDIEMQDGSGFDLLDQISTQTFSIIFTTAYDQFALRAFNYNAIDYLLKPINPDRLAIAIKKIKSKTNQVHVSRINLQQPSIPNKIELNIGNQIHWISPNEIIYIQADTCYTYVFLKAGQKLVLSKTMKYIEELIPSSIFFRIHHSYIVNTQLVRYFSKEEGGVVVLENGVKLPVSRRKKEYFLSRIKS